MTLELAPLGERELEVMGVLWTYGAATVAEVRERVQDDLAYTTVLTILRNLEAKGFVAHEEVGRAHRFIPSIERVVVQDSATVRLIRAMFGGSAEALVLRLVDDQLLDADGLARLAKEAIRRSSSDASSPYREDIS